MRTALAISPHLDDAAFSVGGTLARLTRRGWCVVVATVFTRSVPDPQGFALACQIDKGLSADTDYMALRRAEDEAACAALGALLCHLPFAEAPHRGYEDARALFAGRRPGDDVGVAVAAALRDLADNLAPTLILGPRGVGAHVDHLVVRDAMAGLRAPTAWWTDWPYAGRADAAEPYAEEDHPRRRIAVPVRDLEAKLAACAAYETQLGFQFGGAGGMRRSVGAVAREVFVMDDG